jgi:hypothetical protein
LKKEIDSLKNEIKAMSIREGVLRNQVEKERIKY